MEVPVTSAWLVITSGSYRIALLKWRLKRAQREIVVPIGMHEQAQDTNH